MHCGLQMAPLKGNLPSHWQEVSQPVAGWKLYRECCLLRISHVLPAAPVIDESSQTLFLTEMFRGLNLTLKAFFDRKVTVSEEDHCVARYVSL